MLNSIRGNEPIVENTSATKIDKSNVLNNGVDIDPVSSKRSEAGFINPETPRTANKLPDISQAKIEQATKTLKKELSEELNRDLNANKNKAPERAIKQKQPQQIDRTTVFRHVSKNYVGAKELL